MSCCKIWCCDGANKPSALNMSTLESSSSSSSSSGIDRDKMKLQLEAEILESPEGTLSKTQIATLKQGFAEFDSDGSGTIDYQEFEDIVYNVLFDEAEKSYMDGWIEAGNNPDDMELPSEVEPTDEEIQLRVKHYLKLFGKTASDEIGFNEYCVLYGPNWLLDQHAKLAEEKKIQEQLAELLMEKRRGIEERREKIMEMPRYSEVLKTYEKPVKKLFNSKKSKNKDYVTPKQADAIFKKLKMEWIYQRNDQNMTFEELLDLIAGHKVTSKVFVILDTDADGSLSFEELQHFHKLRFPNSSAADERFHKRFERYDKDGSGLLSYGEAFLYLSTSLKDLHEKVDFELQQVIEEFALVL
eukprot:TRINITY_DN3005_c0_g1_i4.p1 TRINITY_DN3005_c0_g1~~TRINITY_DN3005_c0_g1_i4.p1  ORF type:complete len:356 (-),score=121.72 TRINITY_DN3005_c0_g1_i4:11-1078(-)